MQNQLAVAQHNLDNYQAPPAASILYLALFARIFEVCFDFSLNLKRVGSEPSNLSNFFLELIKCSEETKQITPSKQSILNLCFLACVLLNAELNYMRELAVAAVQPNNFNWLQRMHANKAHPHNCSKHPAKPMHYKSRALTLHAR